MAKRSSAKAAVQRTIDVGGGCLKMPGPTADGAVVSMVRLAEVEVTGGFAPELSVTEDTEKLQVDSLGSPEQSEGARLIVPLNPFCVENVSIVDPAAPGLVTEIGLVVAATEKLGGGSTTSVRVPKENA